MAQQKFQFGPLVVSLACRDRRLDQVLSKALTLYRGVPHDVTEDLRVVVDPSQIGIRRPLRADHWDFDDGFAARFGHFFVERWQLDGDTPTVTCGIAPSPLYPVRPFLDYEFHTARMDFGKLIHEHVLMPNVLLLHGRRLAVFHAATLANSDGKAVMVTGGGGVGKTSLALELGRRGGWSFISDDMVVADDSGTVHLNASWPKVYAYNVAGDPALERQLLEGRSAVDRLHWRLVQRWPARVRRSLSPDALYGGVQLAAPLALVLQVVRNDVAHPSVSPISPEELARESARVMSGEMQRFGRHVALHADYRRSHSLGSLDTTWSPTDWGEIAVAALRFAATYRMEIPLDMGAMEYRRAALSLIDEVSEVLE